MREVMLEDKQVIVNGRLYRLTIEKLDQSSERIIKYKAYLSSEVTNFTDEGGFMSPEGIRDNLREWIVRADKDRKSTRLNSSHVSISYAVFCLKKKSIRSHH